MSVLLVRPKYSCSYFIIFFFYFLSYKSSNTLGGDITWTCNGTGNFIFKLRIHVQCGGTPPALSFNLTIQNHPTVNAVTVNQISQTDISPNCGSAGPSISCNTGGQGAVSEYIYVSSPINLPGIPPPGGWIITYTECCRNSNTNLNISANSGLTLYSKIYPYQGNNNSPCYDNSVDFLRAPSSITCSSQPQNILFFPYDSDLDSLSAKWATPLNSFTGSFNPPISPAPINFNSGYSFNNPFPNSGTGNVAAVLIEETGEIKFTSQQSGDFSYALIFESWRCGTKIAEVYKEFQIALTSCGSNVSPVVSAPFSSGFDTTVVAGTLLNFNINATDVNVQNISWEANGNQFGSGFSNNSSGCTNPPCATLNPTPPSTTSGTNSISFNWQTDCVHLGSSISCNITGKTYFFYLTAKDDFCPVPGINNQVIIVRLTPPPVLPSPEIKCISVINPTTTSIQWEIPPDPNNTFSKYLIYFSNNLNGPYDTLTTINNYSQNQYTFTNPSGVINNYYFIKSFGCGGFVSSVAIDTVRPITLTVNNPSNGTAQLFWNSISNS
ncbi:MAG: hypothetical protein ACK452_14670, partial [Bacteroidota bacterium]